MGIKGKKAQENITTILMNPKRCITLKTPL